MSFGRGQFLTYTMYEDYVSCPLRYYWKHLKKRLSVIPDVPLYRFLGIVWNDFLEVFYKEARWGLRKGAREWSRKSVEGFFESQEKNLMIHWKEGEREEYLEEAIRVVDVILDTLRDERLVSQRVEVEKSLSALVGPEEKVWGRFDLRLVKGEESWLIDFKGTKHNNLKYAHDDQLYWYAILHRAAYGKLPSYLGFWLLRFGRIHWIDPSEEAVKDLLTRVRGVFASLRGNEFTATPSVKSCEWCLYREQCEPRNEFEATRPRKNRPALVDVCEDDGFGEAAFIDV